LRLKLSTVTLPGLLAEVARGSRSCWTTVGILPQYDDFFVVVYVDYWRNR